MEGDQGVAAVVDGERSGVVSGHLDMMPAVTSDGQCAAGPCGAPGRVKPWLRSTFATCRV